MHSCDIDGIPVLLLRLGEDVLAMSGACSHRGAPLGEGKVEGAAGDCVRCPWHGSLFSFRDGSVVEGPATFPQGKLETRIVAGQISVRAPQR
jgi:nitrite reductase/ring-hydroxylating ferredoxin subunit